MPIARRLRGGALRKGKPMAVTVKYDGGLTCSLQSTDLARSIRWYQDVLGFKLL